MFRRGINYDVGIEVSRHYMSRPTLDPVVMRRELEIVRDDLHCNAVRISGTDKQRLLDAAEVALELGLEVWLSPQLHDAEPQQTLEYTVDLAARAAELWERWPRVVLVVGCELTWFMQGILRGATFDRRLGNPTALLRLKWSGKPGRLLNDFLAQLAPAVRAVFPGRLTYASAPLERVDWAPFDYVGLDYYRGAKNRDGYGRRLARHFAFGKPVVITELGLCTYLGAENAGARGWAITEVVDGQLRIKGHRERSEDLQARELVDMLRVVEAAGVAGVFVFTLVSPALPHNADPRLDLDLASYSIVKSYADRSGTTYLDLPWDPKAAFTALASHYPGLASGPGQPPQ